MDTQTLKTVLTHGLTREQIYGGAIIVWRGFIFVTCVLVWGNVVGADSSPSEELAKVAEESKSALAKVVEKVDEIQEAQKQERLERLDIQIFEMRRAFCKERNSAVKAQYGERINELVRRYYVATRQWPRLPGCDET